MKSEFVEKFNHDFIASKYDEDVADESHPIRTGYKSLLEWVSQKAEKSHVLIDLGCGTGNTVLELKHFEKVYCVDVSQNMLAIAKEKLKEKENIEFVQTDLFSFFDSFDKPFDTVISTYAIHHLTQREKHQFLRKIHAALPKGGRVIFGDLMFESKAYEVEMRKKYPKLEEEFDDEFFWYVEEERKQLEELGFTIEVKQFADLSWGIFGVL